MNNTNARRNEQLGMPFGTANARLRKLILFNLLEKYKENICFQCGRAIDSVDDLSIEHKIAWLDKDISLFWDLDNIAFSHLSCNVAAANKDWHKSDINKARVSAQFSKVCPEGQAWCCKCGCVPKDQIGQNKAYHKGIQYICKSCRKLYRKQLANRTKV